MARVETADPEPRRDALAAAGLVGLAIAAALAMHAVGLATRSAPRGPGGASSGPEVVLVRSGREALALWHGRGLQGRILVHAGRFFHFVSDGHEDAMRSTLLRPGMGADLDARLLATAGPRGYLFAAASTGIARRIEYVSPPATLEERLAAMDLAPAALPALLPSQAFPRRLRADLPGEGEPVLLELSASWFDDPRAPDLLALVRDARLPSDLVVVNLAEDAADVSEPARAAARDLAASLGARSER
jgi:hypothetical protein